METLFSRLLILSAFSFCALACGKPTVRIHSTGEVQSVFDVSKYKNKDGLYLEGKAYDFDGKLLWTASGDAPEQAARDFIAELPQVKICEYNPTTEYFKINGKDLEYRSEGDDFYFEIDPTAEGSRAVDFYPIRNSPRLFYWCGSGNEVAMIKRFNLFYSLLDNLFENGKPKNQGPTGTLP